jgi:hypothetical protein
MNWMIKNSDGKPDAMLTISVVAFATVTFNLILATFGTFTVPAAIPLFGGTTFAFSEMSAGTMSSYLAPTLAAYCARRFTDKGKDFVKLDKEIEAGITEGAE